MTTNVIKNKNKTTYVVKVMREHDAILKLVREEIASAVRTYRFDFIKVNRAEERVLAYLKDCMLKGIFISVFSACMKIERELKYFADAEYLRLSLWDREELPYAVAQLLYDTFGVHFTASR